MNNSKFISLLKTFSKKELLGFEKLLVSPYFGCKQFTVGVFLELKKNYPYFRKLDKKVIFENAFPGKPYNDVLLRKAMSLLSEYAARFIILQLPESEPELADYRYVNYTRRHTLFKLCEKRLREFDRLQDNSEIHLDYFQYRYLLEREKVFYKLAAFSQKDACESVVSRNEYLLLDFLSKFAVGLYEMDANKSGFNYDYSGSGAYLFYKNINFEKFFDDIGRESKYTYIYDISSNMIKMAINPDDTAYFNLKDAVMKHYNKFHFSFTFILYSILSAYSLNKFKRENFEINKFMLDNDFFLKYGAYFQLKDFIKILKSALAAGKVEWAENFLEKYVRYLDPAHQPNTLCYANALIHYKRKQFSAALENLSKVKYQLFSFKQDINVMALEIHYELGNYETSFSLIDSYKHFLRENKFVDETARDRYNSFIGCYTMLLNAKIKEDSIIKSRLKKEIDIHPMIVGSEWLKEKTEEL